MRFSIFVAFTFTLQALVANGIPMAYETVEPPVIDTRLTDAEEMFTDDLPAADDGDSVRAENPPLPGLPGNPLAGLTDAIQDSGAGALAPTLFMGTFQMLRMAMPTALPGLPGALPGLPGFAGLPAMPNALAALIPPPAIAS